MPVVAEADVGVQRGGEPDLVFDEPARAPGAPAGVDVQCAAGRSAELVLDHVVLHLAAEREPVAADDRRGGMGVEPPPHSVRAVGIEVVAGIDVAAPIVRPAVGGATRIASIPNSAFVLRSEEHVAIVGPVAGVAEHGAERAGGDGLAAVHGVAAQGEAAVRGGEECAPGALVVDADGAAAARLRRVQLRKVEVGTTGPEAGDGGHEVETVGQAPPVGRARPARLVAPALQGDLAAVQVPAAARDDVDHGEEGVVAVDGGSRATDDLDALDESGVQAKLLADQRLVVDVVVDAQAVHHEQHARAVVARPREPVHADVAVVVVVRDVEAGDVAQDVGQGPVAVAPDLVGGHDGHEGRGFTLALAAPRGGVDHLQRGELLDGEAGQVRWVGRQRDGGQGHRDQQCTNGIPHRRPLSSPLRDETAAAARRYSNMGP